MRSAFRISSLFLLFVPAALFAAEAGSVDSTVVGTATSDDTPHALFSVPFNPYVIHSMIDGQGRA